MRIVTKEAVTGHCKRRHIYHAQITFVTQRHLLNGLQFAVRPTSVLVHHIRRGHVTLGGGDEDHEADLMHFYVKYNVL